MLEPSRRHCATRADRAFTLIELLTVIAIVAVLAGIVIGMGRRASIAAKSARARTEIAALASALESYRQHYGDFPQATPDTGESTQSGETLFAALNGWHGPALTASNFTSRRRVFLTNASLTLGDPTATETASNHFVDPWGNPYHYAYNTAASGWRNPSFVLFSSGPDGLAIAVANTGYLDTTVAENLDNLFANQ